MLNILIRHKNIRPVMLLLAISFLAYQIGKIVPGMHTLSLGTWMRMAFFVIPGIVLVILVALWSPSGQIMRLERPKLPTIKDILSKGNLMFLLPMYVLCGVVTFWLIMHFPIHTLVGQAIVFGSMFSMLVLGMIKPELGPAVFFILYPFQMFVEARLYAWSWLGWMIQNIPEWLQMTLFGLENISIVLLMFTIGFLYFFISNAKQIGKTMLDKPIILLLIWTLVSVATANDHLVALRLYLVKWIFPVGIYYATFLAIKRTNGIREIKLALMVLLFLSCLLSIQHAALTKEVILSTGERAKIWTIIAGQMGPWSVIILPLTCSFLFDRKEAVYVRIFSVFTIILSLVMVVWEMQRVVVLDFALMLALSFILYHRKWRWHLILYATLGLIGFFSFDKIITLIEYTRPSLLLGNPFASSVNLDRLYLFEQGWDIVKHNPFLGIGPGGFKLLYIGLNSPEVSSHNMFLEVALESGVVASVLFTTIMFVPIVKFARSFIKGTYRNYEHDLRPWIISLVAFCFVHHMLHSNWSWGYGVAIFCMLGVVVGTMSKVESKELST